MRSSEGRSTKLTQGEAVHCKSSAGRGRKPGAWGRFQLGPSARAGARALGCPSWQLAHAPCLSGNGGQLRKSREPRNGQCNRLPTIQLHSAAMRWSGKTNSCQCREYPASGAGGRRTSKKFVAAALGSCPLIGGFPSAAATVPSYEAAAFPRISWFTFTGRCQRGDGAFSIRERAAQRSYFSVSLATRTHRTACVYPSADALCPTIMPPSFIAAVCVLSPNGQSASG